jgi:large subunit ribosomal protein L10
MDRATKEAELADLVGRFSRAQVAVCLDYRGLTVAKVTTLRSNLRKAGSSAKVVRNTLAKLAVERAGGADVRTDELHKFLTVLDGPTMVVFSDEDPIAPTKVLADFVKGTGNDKLRVKGCWLDGAYVDAEGVSALSKLPGREEVFSMLLGLLSAPATRLARVISEPGAQVARVVEAFRKKLGGE